MFSSLKNKSFLKKAAFFKKAAFLILALFLSAGLLFISCSDNEVEGADSIPVGNWASPYDGYKITKSTLEQWSAESVYNGVTYPATSTKGSISEAVAFSSSAGVLIVKVTSDTSSNSVPTGKFIGIYYKDVTASHASLATAYDTSTWTLIVKDTLADAKAIFTVDKVGTHVSMWGAYDKGQ